MIINLIILNLKIAFNELKINLMKRHVQTSLVFIGFSVTLSNILLNQFLQSNLSINSWIINNLFFENREIRGFFLLSITFYYFIKGFFGINFKKMFNQPDYNFVFNSASSQREIYISKFFSNMFIHIFYGATIFLSISPILYHPELHAFNKTPLFLSIFITYESIQLLGHISYNIRINFIQTQSISRKIITILLLPTCIFLQTRYLNIDILSTNNITYLASIFSSLLIISFYLCNSYLDNIISNSGRGSLLSKVNIEKWDKNFPVSIKDVVTTTREGGEGTFFEFFIGFILFIYFSNYFSLIINSLPNYILNVITYFYPFFIIILYHSFIPYTNLLKNDIQSYWLINLSKITLEKYLINKYIFFITSSIIFLITLIIISKLTELITMPLILILFNTFIVYNLIGFYINTYSIIYHKISSENSLLINFLQIFSSLAFYLLNINLLSISYNYLILLSILLLIMISLKYEKPSRYFFLEILSILFMIILIMVLIFGFFIFLRIQDWTIIINQINVVRDQQILVCFSSISLTLLIFKIVDQLINSNFKNAKIET